MEIKQQSGSAGFMLIELLVVISIIGVLASVILVSMSGLKQHAIIAHAQSFSASLKHNLGSDCVGDWEFNEGSGAVAKDNSGYGNNGAITGATFVAETAGGNNINGQYGLKFSVGNYVNMGNPTSLGSNGEITVEAWVKFDGLDYTGSTGRLVAIAAKGAPDSAGANNGWWFTYDNRNNGKGFGYTCFGNSAGGWAGGGNNFSPSTYNYTFTNGIWYHLAFTINSTQAKLYINGNPQGPPRSITNLALQDNVRNLYVGAYSGGTASFQGVIDSVEVYGQSFPSAQIKSHYLAGLNKLLANKQITTGDYQKRTAEAFNS